MRYYYQSYAVQTQRKNVPLRIKYFFIRALMNDITLAVAPMSPWMQDKMKEEWYRRVATLMTLDQYSATHPFDKEDVEIEPTRIPADEIREWWARYKHMAPDLMVEMIWAEVDE